MNKMVNPNAEQDAQSVRTLPDVARSSAAAVQSTLDWVGMAGIALPITLNDQDQGRVHCDTSVQTFVNITDPATKGIHMSRLYLLLQERCAEQPLTPKLLSDLMLAQCESQNGISDAVRLHLSFDLLLNRPALRSEYSGWKAYPVEIDVELRGSEVEIDLKLSVPYSSTCPCSASLSRQLLEEALQQDFADQTSLSKTQISEWLLSERGSVATPHSQRSWAYLKLRLDCRSETGSFPLVHLINGVENALQTPVQTAVKREDEQAFAALNGQNLMFCEDAARRIRAVLMDETLVRDFWLKVSHEESLHAHNAVAITTRGLAGGFTPQLSW